MARRNIEVFEAPDQVGEPLMGSNPGDSMPEAMQPVYAETEAAAPVGDSAAIDVDLTLKAKDETIAAREREISALHETIAKKNEMIASLEESFKAQGETIDALQGQLGTLRGDLNEAKRDLGMLRLAAKSKASSAPGIERLPGGGIRLAISLDCDEAEPLLSWADSAGEDPATYIAKTLKDALVAVTSS